MIYPLNKIILSGKNKSKDSYSSFRLNVKNDHIWDARRI